jgi:hypothetical protein
MKLSLSAVKKWRRHFTNGRVALEGDPRSERPPHSSLCESVRAFIMKNPFISGMRMCQKLQITKTTCLGVRHENLGFRKCCLRWFLCSITENQAECRVGFPEVFLQVVPHVRETNFNNLLTGDES